MSESPRIGTDSFHLFPSPRDIRQRLADNLEEAQLLRRLLRVSEDAADKRNRSSQQFSGAGRAAE